MSDRTPSQRAALDRSTALEQHVLADPGRFRVLTGDRPTGPLHIGHYPRHPREPGPTSELGVDVIVLIADYQVMTDQHAGNQLPGTVGGVVADYPAAGIDPSRATIFTHSAVPTLNELVLPFLSLVSDAELHRNPTVKAEIQATGKPPTGLMLTYPVHRAADILFCQANLVPVGLDQLPHVETTRLVARRFNERYGGRPPLFPEPEALLTDTPMLAGLDGQKMSKTRGNGIALRAGRLKQLLTQAVNELLRPLRRRRAGLAGDLSYLDSILDAGNDRARQLADNTLSRVHDLLGMTYANRKAPDA